MARNGQRHTASARKSRESRQLTDVSKELQMRLSAEVEKRRESTELTKALKAAKKGSSEILTASSSGRVKTAPARSVPGHLPSTMPSENTTLFPTTHCSEPMSAFIPPQPAPDFSEFFMPSYDALPFGALTAPPALEFPPTISNIAPMELSGIDFSTFDIDVFFGFDLTFITSIRSRIIRTQSHPLSLTDAAFNNLPLLPPPPPQSPPPAAPPFEKLSEAGPSAPKARRSRQEVDEANILTSTRSREPTEKRRATEGDPSDRSQKKGKQRDLGFAGQMLVLGFGPMKTQRRGIDPVLRDFKILNRRRTGPRYKTTAE
ncbi:hypothetical protein B0H17DRAFT_1148342 [Mycena rosella]|uniref:Uncharacterized protein n=1 Tax=Mycena rosella TaxID=1033263 RepID=A0AAD7CCZ5_MYCRO|nr:hypothetical protein B0H17DRAFT_1148342 [Mycena rosella]